MASSSQPENETTDDGDEGLSLRFTRVVRTETSEVYLLWQDDDRVGQLDLHYGWDLVHATLLLERDFTPEEQSEIVDTVDQEIVSSHLPRFTREDFLVTVFRGQELEPFSDGPDETELDDEDEF